MLSLDHATKVYRLGLLGGGRHTAVSDVSFAVEPGEVVSLIGESGSGKSTIGKMILRLLRCDGGSITVDGVDIASLKGADLRAYYRTVQGVFQDPFSSFNPVTKVDHVFDLVRGVYFGKEAEPAWRDRQAMALRAVNLEPGQVLHKYPHQLSGGQLQRMLIARALLLDTRYLVADEIISMLDASTRIDVLNLLGDLRERGLGILFITHDLSLGNYISQRTVILRRGVIVEMGATDKVFGAPVHPYTRMLIDSVPHLHERWEKGALAVDSAAAGPLDACAFHERLPTPAGERLVEVEPDHAVGCFAGAGPCPFAAPGEREQAPGDRPAA